MPECDKWTALHKMVVESIRGCVPPEEIKRRIESFDCDDYYKNVILRKLHMGA